MLSHEESPPRLLGITWSTVRLGLLVPQYWQVHPSRASTALRVIRRRWMSLGTRTKLDQADHLRAVEPHRLRAEDIVAMLENLGLLLQDQDQGASHRADVERLVARVEDQHSPARQPAGGGYRYLAVPLGVMGRVVTVPRAHRVAVDAACYGGPSAHVPGDCSGAITWALRIFL